MVVATATQEGLSLTDFLAMPETKPASEFIDGKIVQKPFADGKHSLLQGALTSAISEQAEGKKIALALMELQCTFGGRSLVPDIAVIRWENLPRDEDGEIADKFERYPDWVIEILSPDQSAIAVMEKIILRVSRK
jgi:Uma2 family endonuclease